MLLECATNWQFIVCIIFWQTWYIEFSFCNHCYTYEKFCFPKIIYIYNVQDRAFFVATLFIQLCVRHEILLACGNWHFHDGKISLTVDVWVRKTNWFPPPSLTYLYQARVSIRYKYCFQWWTSFQVQPSLAAAVSYINRTNIPAYLVNSLALKLIDIKFSVLE